MKMAVEFDVHRGTTCIALFMTARAGAGCSHYREAGVKPVQEQKPAYPNLNTELAEKKFALIDHYKIIMATREKSTDPEFKNKLWMRMWKMEGIFAEGKSHHGLRRARYRGRWKVQSQVYMVSTVQNLKRLAATAMGPLKSFLLDLAKTLEKQFYPLNFAKT